MFDTAVRLGSPVTVAVVGACLALFTFMTALDVIQLVGWDAALETLAVSWQLTVARGWLFELATAPFVHASASHLAFNLLSLWFLGPDVERRLGTRRYLAFSALCGLAGNVAFLGATVGTTLVGCGYSGIIFGLLVAQATWFPERLVVVYALFPMRMRHAALLLGAIELYLAVDPEQQGAVAHASHVAGAAAAWIYLRATRPGWRTQPRALPDLRSLPKEL